MDSVFDKIDKASCVFEVEANGESFLTEPGKLSMLITKSISDVTGRNSKPEFATDGGTSDARFIKDYCEVVELGIRNQTLHQVDEFVFLEDLNELTKIYYKIFLCTFIKSMNKLPSATIITSTLPPLS